MAAFTASPTERGAGDAAASSGEGPAVQPWGGWGACREAPQQRTGTRVPARPLQPALTHRSPPTQRR